MPERRAGDVVRVEERVVRALGLLPPEEPAVLGGREGLAQRRAKGVHVGELARRGGRKAHEVLGPRGAAGGVRCQVSSLWAVAKAKARRAIILAM